MKASVLRLILETGFDSHTLYLPQELLFTLFLLLFEKATWFTFTVGGLLHTVISFNAPTSLPWIYNIT